MRPNIAGLMGAYGAALYAIQMAGLGKQTVSEGMVCWPER